MLKSHVEEVGIGVGVEEENLCVVPMDDLAQNEHAQNWKKSL
jgi:hypothetical protein